MSGWIKLHRKITTHPFYTEKRKFSKYEAWIDIILLANHKDNKFIHGNQLVEVERGSFITSELKLMERWGWGKEKLRSYLKLLENDGMITKISDRKQTTIKVHNYADYQGSPDHEQTENRPPSDRGQTNSRLSSDTNKNVRSKEQKNERSKDSKKEYADYVFLTETEYGKLTELLGDIERDRYFLRFASWISGKSKQEQGRRSAYLTILNWHRNDSEKTIPFPAKNKPLSKSERVQNKLDQLLKDAEEKNNGSGGYYQTGKDLFG